MKKSFLLLALALVCAATSPAHAQDWYSNAPDMEVALDTNNAFEPTPVAVEDPIPMQGGSFTSGEFKIITELADVIRQDLDFSPLCSLVFVDSQLVRHLGISKMDAVAWKRSGASYHVRLEASVISDTLVVRYRAIYSETDREISTGKFQGHRAAVRALAHKISNDIYHNIFGEKGIFDTKVCFVVTRGEGRDIYVSDYDGANPTRVVNNGALNLSPTFTPDGAEILYTSYIDGQPKIFSARLATGKSTLVAGHPGMNFAPAVSPDGDRICCVLTKDGNSDLYLLDRRGRIIRRLTSTRAIESGPSFSADGREIVFVSDRTGAPQIYIMDSEGLNVRRVSYEGNYNDSPDWSPKSDLIAFVSRTDRGRFDICTIKPTGSDFRILTDMGTNENPHFSPDGNSVIYSSTRAGQKEIYTMQADGRRQMRLTRSGKSGDQGGASNPSWGPLGE